MNTDKPPGSEYDFSEKRVLTTGDIAKYCNVHFRTVIRWIEKGRLKAYKLPGRGNNRIEEEDFIIFLQENHMPIPAGLSVRNKRVLIVDDEKEMASALQRVLRRTGYETAIAQDGFQAGDMLATFQPALMTLDLSMPNMDGFSVLQYLRNNSHYKALKIVVISALDESELARARAAGAHRSLTKPFENSALLAIVEQLIGEPDM